MQESARIAAVIAVLGELAQTSQAADEVLHCWLRQRRYIGSHDRRRITALFYTVLRHHLRLEWHCAAAGLSPTPRALMLAALRLIEGLPAADILILFQGEGYGSPPLSSPEAAALGIWHDLHPTAMPEAIQAECPPQHEASLRHQFGAGFKSALTALIPPAPTDLRVNRHKTRPAEVIKVLGEQGLVAVPIPELPDGLRLPPRPGNLRGLKVFTDGWLEPQDASSQLAVQACVGAVTALHNPAEPRLRILDFCAGAGGKTLALAAALGPRAEILAWDSDPERLRRLAPRLRRSGAQEYVSVVENPEPYLGGCDAVLVDAPCSGTGTWRRHPEARRRYSTADVDGFIALQQKILAAAASYVRPGGLLMYCTCSLLPEEDQEQAAWFSRTHSNFERLALPSCLPASGLLAPHQTATDGFFVALWMKMSG